MGSCISWLRVWEKWSRLSSVKILKKHGHQEFGKVMFSVMRVWHSVCSLGRGNHHVTITHDTLDLTVEGLSLAPLDIGPGIPSPSPQLLIFSGHHWKPVQTVHLRTSLPPEQHLVVVHWTMYSLQASSMHPNGILSCQAMLSLTLHFWTNLSLKVLSSNIEILLHHIRMKICICWFLEWNYFTSYENVLDWVIVGAICKRTSGDLPCALKLR